MAGLICTEETSKLNGSEVFVSTRPGLAAIEAAGHAVAAVVQGQGVRQVAVDVGDGYWYSDPERGQCVSQEACVLFLLAGAMAVSACGLDDYGTCSSEHVRPLDNDEAMDAIAEWDDCPLRDPSATESDDVSWLEEDCLFALYKVRALRLLKQPQHISAILALAQELLTRKEVPADEATALNQRHLASV